MRCVFLFLLTLCGIFTPSAYADSIYRGSQIKVVYANQWDPVSYGSSDAAYGLLPDLVDKILAQQMGMKVVHIPVPWGRAQEMVKYGEADAFVTTVTPERLEYAYATKTKFFLLPFNAVVRRDDAKAQTLTDPDDLSAYKNDLFCDVLGNGWATNFYKDQPVRLYIAPSIKECLRLLAAKRVQGIVHAKPVVEKYIAALNLGSQLTVLTPPSKLSPNFAFLLSKKSSLGPDFIHDLDMFLSTIPHDPTSN
ncbi:substrate-binding periplasmic protein [Terasakiella pusilla]|uniref:substrate-binding periplasmic protein n=1 Tax=Terasakiella pusilla TaxID=64973 RepID=UPI003AA8F661